MQIKNKYVAYVVYVVAFIILWNLLDFLIASFITHGPYTFTVLGDGFGPLWLALLTGYFAVIKKK